MVATICPQNLCWMYCHLLQEKISTFAKTRFCTCARWLDLKEVEKYWCKWLKACRFVCVRWCATIIVQTSGFARNARFNWLGLGCIMKFLMKTLRTYASQTAMFGDIKFLWWLCSRFSFVLLNICARFAFAEEFLQKPYLVKILCARSAQYGL